MPTATVSETPSNHFRYRISGMDCGSCALTIEQSLRQLDGVEDVHVSFTTETVQGSGRVSPEAVRRRIEALGYRMAEPAPAPAPPEEMRGIGGFFRFLFREPSLRLALALGVVVLATLPLQAASADPSVTILIDAVRWLVIAVVGYPIALRGVRSLIHARRITIELLMTAAVVGAVAIGAAGEAVTVILLFTLGEALEAYAATRSRDSLRGLLNLRPAEATVIRNHAEPDGREHRHYRSVPVTALQPGDRVLVRPGEKLPADGRVVDGASAVDESAITGESVPVHRTVGNEVFAGTINGQGTLEVEVDRLAEDFTISQIARLVEQAQAQRSPAERFVDRFAAWYTPAVVVLAVLVATAPPLLLGQPFLTVGEGAPGWLYRGLALLIIACPCALVISIPVTVVSALTRLAGLGVLVKGGAQLDELARTRIFAFDKTGTLTHGRPVLSGTRSSGCDHDDDARGPSHCTPCDDMVALAAAVERGSEHPFAHAVLSAANERRLQHRYAPANDITAHAGRGVSGTLEGQRITVGHRALFPPSPELDALLEHEEDAERSVMVVGRDDRPVGVIHVEDELRESTRAALEALKAVDPQLKLVMLTGDRRQVAEAIGRRLKEIDDVRAELMPAQKLEAVRELTREGPVAMVGDGINDAPALAAARLGVAMGGAGSHQAMEVADVVLMQDDLSHLPLAVRISRKTQRLVRQNIALSIGLKLAFLGLAIPGIATLWMAVLADVGATIVVTLNGMRMLRAR